MQNECKICGNIEDTASVEIDDVNVILCKDCRSKIILKCDCCNKIFLANEEEHVITSNGEVFCEICKYEELSYCERCNEYVYNDEVTYVRGANEYWCSDCIDAYAHKCECCGNYTTQDYGDGNITRLLD